MFYGVEVDLKVLAGLYLRAEEPVHKMGKEELNIV